MPELTYCTAVGFWAATTGDGSDVGVDPDLVPIRGDVTFTYRVKVGEVFRAVTLDTPTGVLSAAVPGVLRNGVLKDLQGNTGVRLLANTDQLHVDGPLHCAVTFTNTTFNGSPIKLNGFTFALPDTDTTVDLIEVTPVTGADATGITFGQPTYAVLVDAGPPAMAQWKTSGGANVGPVTEFPVLDISSVIDALIDGAPGALDTLNELAAALGDDANFAATVTNALAGKPTAYATIAALRAATVSSGQVLVGGYYGAGDGGGGVFRWDSTDTTSTDNGGTIITPSGGLSSSGRWKRVYEGEVNARWFGVNPSQSDNTAALQKAIDWVSAAYPTIGGTVFIPMGWYVFLFSSASTITIPVDNVLIRGEGKGSRLMVSGHARPSQVSYFFTFTQSGRGQGGGVRDLNFYGNSMLKWCIYLNTWRDIAFENISAFDVHSGILDAEATNTSLYGENVTVRHIDHAASAGTAVTQYGVRFRSGAGATAKTWSDCWISDLDIICCWDAGVVLDGVDRFHVQNVVAANNLSLTDSVDGAAKAGCKNAVHVANTNTVNSIGGGLGNHKIDNVYLESLQGSETPTTNVAVLIDILSGVAMTTRGCRINHVNTSGNVGKVRFYDANGFGRVHDNVFETDRAALHHDFGTKSNGTPSATMDTGQIATPFTLSTTSGSPDAWSVLSGKVGFAAYGSTVATSDGVNHAVYWPVDLGAPITRVKVPVTWPAASVGGSQFTIVLPSAAWGVGSLPAAGIHFAASGNGQWHCSKWNGSSEDAHYMDDAMYGRFTAQNTGVEGVFEFYIDRAASTLQVFFPDGSFTPAVYNSAITAFTGSRVVFELFVSSVVNDIPPMFGEFTADTDTSVLTSDTSVVRLPDVARLVAGASGGSLALTTTAGGTTTLTATSAKIQEFSGTLNQTVVMPSTDVAAGDDPFFVVNASTGVITINASAGGFMAALASGETASVQALGSTPTLPGSWLTLLFLTRDGTQVVRNKTVNNSNTIEVKDTSLTVESAGASTKKANLIIPSGQTASTTRSHTLPPNDSTLAAQVKRSMPKTSGGTTQWGLPCTPLLSSGTIGRTLNVVQYVPLLITYPVVITNYQFEVTTAPASNGSFAFCIYAADGDMQPSGAPVYDSGSVAVASGFTGLKTGPGSLTIALTPGLYLVGTNCDQTMTCRMVSTPNHAIIPGMGATPLPQTYFSVQTFGAFPNPGLKWASTSNVAGGVGHAVFFQWTE